MEEANFHFYHADLGWCFGEFFDKCDSDYSQCVPFWQEQLNWSHLGLRYVLSLFNSGFTLLRLSLVFQ